MGHICNKDMFSNHWKTRFVHLIQVHFGCDLARQVESVSNRVIPSEAVTELCGHRLQFASWYIQYYQAEQIGVGPRTDFHQIGTLDME